MTGWSFDPVGGWTAAIAVALVLAPLLAIGPPASKQSSSRRLALVALRAATLVLLMLLWLRPALETRTTRKLPGTLVVLADSSRSMTVADAPGDRPRFAAMKTALNGAADQLLDLSQTWTIHGYTFGETTEPLKIADGLFAFPASATGTQTAIGATIDDVLAREAQQRIVAIILLSDGAQRAFAPRDTPPQSAARRLAADGIPLYTLAFGKSSLGEQSDLRLSDLQAADAVFADTPATIEGVVAAAGYVNQQFTVRLLWESADGKKMEPVDSRKVSIVPGKTRYPVRLTHTPREPGEFKVTLEVESPAGELVTSNNSQSTFVTVLKGGVNVLYLAGSDRVGGSPGVDPRFIRASLAAFPDLHVDYQPLNYRSTEADARDQIRDRKYDVFLLGNVDSSAFNARTWREIAQEVDRGAGLAMLGGFHSFGPGGFANTALADVLPINLGRDERQNFGEPTRTDVHIAPGPQGLKMLPVVRGGQVHPILVLKEGRDNLAQWEQLPALDGANRLDRLRLKPTAQVAAEGNDPSRSPLLVLSSYGDGRVAALAVDSTWHWPMEGFGEAHRRFWRQLVLWLAKKDESAGKRVWVRLDQRRYQQGSRVDFTFGAENENAEPTPGAKFDVQIEKPDGTTVAVKPNTRSGDSSASFNDTASQGDYRIKVAASNESGPLGEATARFSISDQDIELDQPAAEPLMLKSLAELTASSGGAALAPEELPYLLDQLREKTKDFEEEIVETLTLWDRWPALLAVVGLLSTEWFLRKRWGMA